MTFDWRFETFGDKVLKQMLDEAVKWCMLPNKSKSFLTFSGPTEVGKTYLIKQIKRLHEESDSHFPKRKFNYPEIIYLVWSETTRKVMDDKGLIDKIEHAGIVFIEDFLSENLDYQNPWTNIVVETAYRITNLRVGKPTVIDTNKSIKDIELVDKRIASRLFREGGVFLDIPAKTKKFSDRK